jgi:hypothetical protein
MHSRDHQIAQSFFLDSGRSPPLILRHTQRTVTYDHRLKRIGHPVRYATHKLVIHLLITLNRANRNSVESEPLAASRVILG